jgi:uncharacterized protein YdhG (YjbR/CyaY superfamily)
MVRSRAKTVAEYLKQLPPERRKVVAKVRSVIRKNLPKGYRERMAWGGISYEIPLSRHPHTYNGEPLCYAGLGAQKNYYAVHLISVYSNRAEERKLRAGFKKAGKKLDMGKSCVRFKRLEDLDLPTIGRVIAGTTPEQHIARYHHGFRKA